MPQPPDQESVIKSAVANHKGKGHPTPSPSAIDAIREWAKQNPSRIDRAINAGWKEGDFSKRLTHVLGNAQKATGGEALTSAHVVRALDDPDPTGNGCNC
jgi:hypothetical protein